MTFSFDRRELKTSRARVTACAAALTVLVAIGIVRTTVSHYLSDPRSALQWQGANTGAAVTLADQLRQAGDNAAAAALLPEALAADPLAYAPLNAYGLAADAAGADGKALVVMRAAADRSLHNEVAHRWLLVRALKNRDYPEAVSQADVLLRAVNGDLRPIYSLLASFVGNDAAADVLVRELAKNPPWRAGVLALVADQGADLARVTAFFQRLRGQGGGLTTTEAQAYRTRLMRAGRYELAYLDWLESLPSATLAHMGQLYNADFAAPVTNSVFDWQFGTIAGAEISLVGQASERILRVEFAGGKIPFRHVEHLLMLAPGVYRLSGKARAEDLITDTGLVWQVSCDGVTEPIGQSSPLSGSVPWHEFSVTFSVPPTCRMQDLRLVLPARAALDTVISGRAEYKDLGLVLVQRSAP